MQSGCTLRRTWGTRDCTERRARSIGRLAAILSKLREAAEIDPRLKGSVEALEAGIASVEDAAAQLRDYRETVEFDPERLEQVEARLHEISKLKRKYGGSIAEILKFATAAEEELQRLTRSEERGPGDRTGTCDTGCCADGAGGCAHGPPEGGGRSTGHGNPPGAAGPENGEGVLYRRGEAAAGARRSSS